MVTLQVYALSQLFCFYPPSALRRNLDYLNYSSSLGLDSDFRVNIYYLNYVLFVAFLVWIVWISRVYEQDDFLSPSALRRNLNYLNYFFAVGLDGLDLSTTGSRMFSAFTENLNNRSGIQKNRAL